MCPKRTEALRTCMIPPGTDDKPLDEARSCYINLSTTKRCHTKPETENLQPLAWERGEEAYHLQTMRHKNHA
jgi:hypothetical protein